MKAAIPSPLRSRLRKAVARHGLHASAGVLGLAPQTLARAIDGVAVTAGTRSLVVTGAPRLAALDVPAEVAS